MATATARPTRPPFWRDLRVLRLAGQAVFVVAVLWALREMYLNLEFGVRARGIDLSFDFLNTQANFSIKEGIEYSPADSTQRAFVVGVVNTIRIALVGIVLATVLGLVAGVARLSPNWLLRKIAQVYVELFRNTPILVQIIIWYSAVILPLPLIGGGSIFGVAYISNRGAAVPWIESREGAGTWGLVLLAALILAGFVWRWRTGVNERTGARHHRVLWGLGVFIPVAAAGYALLGEPLVIDVPQQVGRGYLGGIEVSGEFAAVLIALSVYTGAFIAEIVRGSILAVPKGQKEAAEALGLTRLQQLRFVVLPQALRIAIPAVNSQYLNLTKNSSLGLAVGYLEVVGVGNIIINQKGRPFQVQVMWVLTFLALTLTISAFMNLLNYLVARRGELR